MIVDGVEYVDAACVACGKPMSVPSSALAVADTSKWPRCVACSGWDPSALERLRGEDE